MSKNKDILVHCPNFYKIVNFEYLEDDYVTEKLICIYQEYIFNINLRNEADIKSIANLDKVLSKYIDDYYFRKELQNSLKQIRVKQSEKNVIKIIIDNIFKIFDLYEEGTTRKIYITRWI